MRVTRSVNHVNRYHNPYIVLADIVHLLHYWCSEATRGVFFRSRQKCALHVSQVLWGLEFSAPTNLIGRLLFPERSLRVSPPCDLTHAWTDCMTVILAPGNRDWLRVSTQLPVAFLAFLEALIRVPKGSSAV